MGCKLSLIYSKLEAVIIDEISMVSNIWLYQIHCWISEISIVSLDIPFAGLTVILLADLHQLPPFQEKCCIFLQLLTEFMSHMVTF